MTTDTPLDQEAGFGVVAVTLWRARRKQIQITGALVIVAALISVVLLVNRSQERALGESLAKQSLIDVVGRFHQIVLEDAGTNAVVLEEWARALHAAQLANSSVELWAIGASKQRFWLGEVASPEIAARRLDAELWSLKKIEARYSHGASACLALADLWESGSNVAEVVHLGECPTVE